MVQLFGTASRGVGGLVAPAEMQATMSNVIAPTTGSAANQSAQCGKISAQLQADYGVQIYAGPVDAIPCFLRVHAQIYLELSDYKRLAEAVMAILAGSDEEVEGVGVQGAGVMMPPLGVAPVRAGGTEE